MQPRNLMSQLPNAHLGEVNEALLAARGVRLERIISFGQATPEGTWYDQQEAEWVMLVTGSARLAIAGEPAELELSAGDTIFLPAHCRHRVTWTDPKRETVWLALFIDTSLEPGCVAVTTGESIA